MNQSRLEANVAVQTRTFTSSDCSVVEGCTVAGSRRLLLFDVGLANIGTGDLVIGNPADYPNLFHFSSCHGHYHFDGTAGYELLTTNGDTVVTARKQGFCFRDDAMFLPNAGPAKFTCENQGISIGWEDIYDKSLDCQWLDITGVPCGDYILRVVANPDGILPELNYSNNVAEVLITLECSTNTPPPPPPPPPGCTNKPPTTCTNMPPTTCTNKPPKCVNHEDWSGCWDWKKLAKMCNGHYQKKCKIPHCSCKCHIPPGKPCKGDKDDHGGKGGGKGGGDGKGDGKDCNNGKGPGDNGGGKGGKDDKDHGGKGNGKDCDKDDDHGGKGGSNGGGNGGHDDKDHGGKGNGKDCDKNDDHGKGGGQGGGKGGDDDHGKGGKGGGKDNDNNHGKGGKGGKDDGKGKGGGKGGGKGNDKGKGKDDANCKPGGNSGKK